MIEFTLPTSGSGSLRRLARRARVWLCLSAFLAGAAPAAGDTGAEPAGNPARPWRLAVYQGGDYGNYHDSLSALTQGLMDLGWLKSASLPEDPEKRTEPLWDWLSREASGPHLEFVFDGLYSAGWDSATRATVRDRLLRRLREKRDIDLVIAIGTWAGRDLATEQHRTPTLVVSSSDPVGAGIVASAEDSGFDHVHAHVDPLRFERQVRVFHGAFGFRRLGVAYEDTVEGRSYAGLQSIETVAAERGFEVVRCHTLSDIADERRANESVLRCFERLVKDADAIYVTEQGGVNPTTVPDLARIAARVGVPTFSQRGTKDVMAGILLSLARGSTLRAVGRFHAETLARVLNGARPRDLDQIYETPASLAINLETARDIGFIPTADLLAAADEIFDGVTTDR